MTPSIPAVLDRCGELVDQGWDRVLARQVVGRTCDRLPGQPEDVRLVESARRLGLRVRAIDASPASARGLSRPDRPLLAFRAPRDDRPATWVLVAGPILERFDPPDSHPTPIRHAELTRLLRDAEGGDVRWYAVEPLLDAGPDRHHDHDHDHDHDDSTHHHPLRSSPTRRLLSLIRPDAAEIRLVVYYAIGVGILSLATPLAIEALVTTVALNQLLQQLVILSLILLACLLLAAGLRALQTYLVELLQRRLFARIAADFAARLPRVRIDAFDRQDGPELVNRFFDVLTVQKVGASLLLDGVSVVLSAFLGLVVLAFYHPFLLGFDLLLLLLMTIMVFLLGRGAIRTSIDESIAKYGVVAHLEDIARAPLAYKCAPAADHAFDRVDEQTTRYLIARQRHFAILLRQILFGLGAQALATAALLGLGGYLVIIEQLNLGQLVAAELIVATVLAGFTKLGKHLESWYDLMAATDKLGHLIDLPLERADGRDPLEILRGPAALEIRHLAYGHDHHPRLRHVDLNVRPGERVLLAGAPGAGKSTLVDLLYGLRQPLSGSILLDGANIRDLSLDALRDRVAVVKRLDLITDSIFENVALGRPEVDLRQVRAALDLVGLSDEVDALPDGLGTRLSGNGNPLSLSQARRLMLARALVGRPSLLVLDGALDGHDPAVRDLLLDATFHPDAPWTLVVTSYDPAVADRCDRLVNLTPAHTPHPLPADSNGHATRGEPAQLPEPSP